MGADPASHPTEPARECVAVCVFYGPLAECASCRPPTLWRPAENLGGLNGATDSCLFHRNHYYRHISRVPSARRERDSDRLVYATLKLECDGCRSSGLGLAGFQRDEGWSCASSKTNGIPTACSNLRRFRTLRDISETITGSQYRETLQSPKPDPGVSVPLHRRGGTPLTPARTLEQHARGGLHPWPAPCAATTSGPSAPAASQPSP